MTNAEAIKELRKFEKCHYETPNGDADLKVYEALSMAIEALEKTDKIKRYASDFESSLNCLVRTIGDL